MAEHGPGRRTIAGGALRVSCGDHRGGAAAAGFSQAGDALVGGGSGLQRRSRVQPVHRLPAPSPARRRRARRLPHRRSQLCAPGMVAPGEPDRRHVPRSRRVPLDRRRPSRTPIGAVPRGDAVHPRRAAAGVGDRLRQLRHRRRADASGARRAGARVHRAPRRRRTVHEHSGYRWRRQPRTSASVPRARAGGAARRQHCPAQADRRAPARVRRPAAHQAFCAAAARRGAA